MNIWMLLYSVHHFFFRYILVHICSEFKTNYVEPYYTACIYDSGDLLLFDLCSLYLTSTSFTVQMEQVSIKNYLLFISRGTWNHLACNKTNCYICFCCCCTSCCSIFFLAEYMHTFKYMHSTQIRQMLR